MRRSSAGTGSATCTSGSIRTRATGFAAQIKTRVLRSFPRGERPKGKDLRARPDLTFRVRGYDKLPVILIIIDSGRTGRTCGFERTKDTFEPFGYLCDGGYLDKRSSSSLSIRPDNGGGTEHTMYKHAEGNGWGKRSKLLKDLMEDLRNFMNVEKDGVPPTWRPEDAKWTDACMTLEEARDQIPGRSLRVEKMSIDAYVANYNNNDPDREVKLPDGSSKADLVETIDGKASKLQFKAARPAATADGGFRVQLNCWHNGKLAMYHKEDADFVVVTRLTSSGEGPRRVTDIWNIPVIEPVNRKLVTTIYYILTGRSTAGQRVPGRPYTRKYFTVYKKIKKGRKGEKQPWTAKYHKTV